MKIIEIKNISEKVKFIRVNPDNLEDTLRDILDSLSNLSWLKNFDEGFLRDSFLNRANSTLKDITRKLKTCSDDKITEKAGEYIVSEISRKTIVNELNYLDIPLAELYNKKKSGNPGFDYHSQNNHMTIIFGEAKYIKKRNAYSSSLKQIVDFIDEKKDINDIPDLRDFCDSKALSNVSNGIKGFAAGFSATNITSDNLIKNICSNANYKELLKYNELILVAINL